MIDYYGKRLAFASDVVVQTIDGEALLLKLQEEEVFSLNATAARIAQLIVERHRIDAVVDILVAEYQASRADVEREVGSLVEVLLSRGLVIVDFDKEGA